MTRADALVIYKDMKRVFGVLPSHIHEPIQFAYKVQLYKLYKSREKKEVI